MLSCDLNPKCNYFENDENFLCVKCQNYCLYLEKLKKFIDSLDKFDELDLSYSKNILDRLYDKTLEEYMDFKIKYEI
jgi:hypothetical protein